MRARTCWERGALLRASQVSAVPGAGTAAAPAHQAGDMSNSTGLRFGGLGGFVGAACACTGTACLWRLGCGLRLSFVPWNHAWQGCITRGPFLCLQEVVMICNQICDEYEESPLRAIAVKGLTTGQGAGAVAPPAVATVDAASQGAAASVGAAVAAVAAGPAPLAAAGLVDVESSAADAVEAGVTQDDVSMEEL